MQLNEMDDRMQVQNKQKNTKVVKKGQKEEVKMSGCGNGSDVYDFPDEPEEKQVNKLASKRPVRRLSGKLKNGNKKTNGHFINRYLFIFIWLVLQ